MPNNNEKIKIAILEISDQNTAVLEYYFSTAGKSFYQETSIEDADAFITDYDYPGAVEHWNELVKTTHKPGIILSISEKQVPSAVWLAKPLSAKALTAAAAQIGEMLTTVEPVEINDVETQVAETVDEPVENESPVSDLVEPEPTTVEPEITAEVETAITETIENEYPIADLVEPETTTVEPGVTAEVETAITETIETEAPKAETTFTEDIEATNMVAEPVIEETVVNETASEEISYEEMLIQELSLNQQPAIEEQIATDTQEKSKKLNKNLSESFEKIFDDNDYQTQEALVGEVTEEIEFEALTEVIAKEKQQTQPDIEFEIANDVPEQLPTETFVPDIPKSKKQAAKAAEIKEVHLENPTEATDEEEIDALLESLIQGEGRNTEPDAQKAASNIEKDSIESLSLEELSLEIEQADAAEKSKDAKARIPIAENSVELEETLSTSNFPTFEEQTSVQNLTPTKELKTVEQSLPSLKNESANKTKTEQAAKKVKAIKKVQAAEKIKAAKKAQAIKKIKAAKAAQAQKRVKAAKAAQAAKKSKPVKKPLIVEESVRVEDSSAIEEIIFAETLEVKAPKDNQVKTVKPKPVSNNKDKNQDALTSTIENDLGADFLDFDFDSLVKEEKNIPKKAVVEDDGSQLNLIDVRNTEQSDLAELVVDKEIPIEKTAKQEATSINELDKLLEESTAINKSLETPTQVPTLDPNVKKNAEQELQALLNEIRDEAEKTSSGKKPISSKFTYGDYPAANSRPSTVHEKTHAEKRWSLLCGENKDIAGAQEIKEISFTLNQHMLSVLLDQLDHAKNNSKQLLRLKYENIIIVIDYAEDSIYCNYSIQSEEFSDYCYRELKPEDIKIHDLDYSEVNLYRKKMMVEAEKTHSIESFVWTTSLLTSRGRLLVHTDITKRIGLKTWPNLTRLELIPHAMNIAAVLSKHPGSLEDIPKWLKIPQRYVFAFYNAALSLDMIELDSRNFKLSTFSFNPKTTSEKITKDRGFISRLLKRLTA